MSYRSNYRRPAGTRPVAPRVNKYPGDCARCGEHVPANRGVAYRDGGRWRVRHTDSRWQGSPVSGGYVGGCPKDTGAQNAALAAMRAGQDVTAARAAFLDSYAPAQPAPAETELVWCENTHHPVGVHCVTNECEDPHNSGRYAPVQAEPGADLREVSRRAGGKYAYTSTGARMTMSSRRCEDAPCCGCCD